MKRTFAILILLFLASCSPMISSTETFPSSTLDEIQTRIIQSTDSQPTSSEKESSEQIRTTPTTLIKTTEVSSASSIAPQTKNLIPNCKNSDHPFSLSRITELEGSIIYRSHEGNEWFLLRGNPPISQTIDLFTEKADSATYSKDGNWMLIYSQRPMRSGSEDQYPVWLVSDNGHKTEVIIDISSMTSIEQNEESRTSSFQSWTISWLTDRIVQVRSTYGESPNEIFPDFIFGYFDIFNEAWLDEPVNKLPNRYNYQWINFSPDLSRMLYLNKDFEIVLWDVIQEKELWRNVAGTSQLPPFAVWSPDHQQVAFWSDGFPEDIQLLSRDGRDYSVIPKPLFKSTNIEFIPYRGFFEWAPDSQRLAITGIIENRQDSSVQSILYIYDVDLKEYVYSCPMGDEDKRTVSSNIIWSPDGNFILPEIYQSKTTPFNLYDIKNAVVYQILPPGYAGVTWLKSYPDSWH